MNIRQVFRYMFVLGVLLTPVPSLRAANSLEPGYYSERSKMSGINEVKKSADRYLVVYSAKEIYIPGLSRARKPIMFVQDDIKDFLKREKHKELLLLEFDPLLLMENQNVLKRHLTEPQSQIRVLLDEFKAFTRDLGYRRVVILGADARGAWVLSDTELKNDQKK